MSMPVLKLRQVVGFPGNIVGGVGIEATKANGVVTIDTDWSDFTSLSGIPTSLTNNVLSYDTLTGVYALIPTPLLTGVEAGTVNAGDLVGTTLASNVINSSLHTVGTLTGGATGGGFTINLSASAVTGTLPVANGGTGAITAATALTNLGGLPLTGGTLSGPLILAADPSAALGAVTKQYVDNIATGLSVKGAVRVATTTPGTLASSFENGDTIDGVVLATGNRILIKNQTAPAENGIYTVNASGAPTRATDLDVWSEAVAAYTFVSAGSTQANTGWVTQVAAGGTIGTTAMPWGQFSSQASYTAGPGVSLVGTNFLLAPGSVTNAMLAAPVSSAKGGTGQDFSASTGVPLYTAGAASVLGTTGTGNVVCAASPTLSNPTVTGTLTSGVITAGGNVTIPAGNTFVVGAAGLGTVSSTYTYLTDASGRPALHLGNATAPVNLHSNTTHTFRNLAAAEQATISDFGFVLPGNVAAGALFAKNGQPWADVKAWGAFGNSSADDTAAIQAAINAVNGAVGGVVFFPPGAYKVTSTITNKGGVRLVGSGRGNSAILNSGGDFTTVAFDPECLYASLEHITVYGYNNSGATQPCVYIPGSGTNGAPTLLQHCTIHHGKAGLKVEGADGFFENCFIWGHTYCVESYGANTYIRCKLDTVGGNSGPHSTAAFYQGAGSGTPGEVKESNFFGGDFSGNYDWAVFVDDASNGKCMLTFYGCVFGGPLALNKIMWFSALGCEFGSTDIYAGSVTGSADGVTGIVSITGSRGLSGTVTLHDNGGIVTVLAGNYHI